MARFLKAFVVVFCALVVLIGWIPGVMVLGVYLGGLVAGTAGEILGGLFFGILAVALLAGLVSVMGKP